MATKSTNTMSAQPTREEMVAAITQQLLSGMAASPNESFLTRVTQWGADKIADSGDNIAAITAGFSAATKNFALARNSELLRQQERTAQKAAKLAEQILKRQGM